MLLGEVLRDQRLDDICLLLFKLCEGLIQLFLGLFKFTLEIQLGLLVLNQKLGVVLFELGEVLDYLPSVVSALKDINVPIDNLELFSLVVHSVLQRSLHVDVSFVLLDLAGHGWDEAIVEHERRLMLQCKVGLEARPLLGNFQICVHEDALQVLDIFLLRSESISLLQEISDD